MNYHITRFNNKHQKYIEIYLSKCFPKYLTCLQEMQINLNLKCEEEILKAYVYNNNIAFMKDPRISDLQEFSNIQLGIIIVQTSTVNYLLMLLQLKWNPRAFITNW